MPLYPLHRRGYGAGAILTLSSHCKVNLGLKITGRREDGYHTIETVFQELDLADRVILESGDEGWQFACESSSIPRDETNLCVKAYLEMKRHFPKLGGVRIRLQKRIPVAAGLGGGSSNAAAVLKGTNELFGLGLSRERLEEIAILVGADVPFFIRGGTQFAESIGEVLSPVTLAPMGAVLLVVPEIHVSTEWAYERVKNHLTGGFQSGKFVAALQSADVWRSPSSWAVAERFFENDFESLVFQTYPEIGDILSRLKEAGALFASLSGSGSTVFGIFGNEGGAEEARTFFPSPIRTFITYPITERPIDD